MLSGSHLVTDGRIIQGGLIYKDILRRCEPRSCYHSQTQRGKGKGRRVLGARRSKSYRLCQETSCACQWRDTGSIKILQGGSQVNKLMAGSHVQQSFCWVSSLAKSNQQVKGVPSPQNRSRYKEALEGGKYGTWLANIWCLYRIETVTFVQMYAWSIEYRSVERTRGNLTQIY